jgi:hypothetical protein
VDAIALWTCPFADHNVTTHNNFYTQSPQLRRRLLTPGVPTPAWNFLSPGTTGTIPAIPLWSTTVVNGREENLTTMPTTLRVGSGAVSVTDAHRVLGGKGEQIVDGPASSGFLQTFGDMLTQIMELEVEI